MRHSDNTLLMMLEFKDDIKNLLSITEQNDGKIILESMNQNPLWEKQGNNEENKRISQLKEPAYLIIQEMAEPSTISLFQVIKFGRLAFRVTMLKDSTH